MGWYRRDGDVISFTDFDRDIFFDAVSYKAASRCTATAIEGPLGLAVWNLDVQGALHWKQRFGGVSGAARPQHSNHKRNLATGPGADPTSAALN